MAQARVNMRMSVKLPTLGEQREKYANLSVLAAKKLGFQRRTLVQMLPLVQVSRLRKNSIWIIEVGVIRGCFSA